MLEFILQFQDQTVLQVGKMDFYQFAQVSLKLAKNTVISQPEHSIQ